MNLTVVTKAIIQNSNGEVLLLQRSRDDEDRPSDWDYPGGGVEDGEDYKLACVREILEEVGVNVEPADLNLFYAATTPSVGDQVSKTRLLFLATVKNPEVKLSFEHEKFEWLAPKRAAEVFTHPVYGTALKYAIEHDLLIV